MNDSRYTVTVKLTSQELDYIRSIIPDELMSILNLCLCSMNHNSFMLSLSKKNSGQFRSFFTEELAKHGFNDNYLPNSEGYMLESLIDRFFCPRL